MTRVPNVRHLVARSAHGAARRLIARRARASWHFAIGIPARNMDTDESEAKRAKTHEAHMIPGVDGYRTFGFPNSIITKIRYIELYKLTSTTGSVASQVMAANGIYDPDVSGGGHQPMYHDYYAGIYNDYTVIGSRIKVTLTNTSSSHAVVWGINGDDDSSGSSTLTTHMEQNNSQWMQVGTATGGHDTGTITANFEPLRDFGVATKDDGQSMTATGSNPSELWCYQIYAAAQDLGTATCEITVEVDYTVKFSELKTPVQN